MADQPYWVIDTGEGSIGNAAGQAGLGMNGGLTKRRSRRAIFTGPDTGASWTVEAGKGQIHMG